MTLSFSQKWPKTMPAHLATKNNYFPVKVLKGLEVSHGGELHAFKIRSFFNYSRLDGFSMEVWQEIKPKIHTIREDKSNRWNPGTGIHFVINNRTKNRLQFAPVLPVVSVQEIKIVYDPDFCEQYSSEPTVLVDGKPLNLDDMELLAKNDGFNDAYEFCHWFKEDFTGKIIHWTNFKY